MKIFLQDYKFKVCIYALVVFALNINPVYSDGITFLVHNAENESYFDNNGELRGIQHSGRRSFQIELVREMMAKLDFTPREFQIVPFKRGLRMITNNTETYAFFNAVKSDERIGLMKFVGPLTTDISYMYELKSTQSGIKNTENVKNKSICVLLGSFSAKMAKKVGFGEVTESQFDNCFKMLKHGRVNYVSILEFNLLSTLRKGKIDPNLIHNTGVSMFQLEGSLVFSNLVPDNIVEKWQSALNEIKQSGLYEDLKEKYLF